jgi:hypothetical protein
MNRRRTFRGGAWYNHADRSTVSFRHPIGKCVNRIGFRVLKRDQNLVVG